MGNRGHDGPMYPKLQTLSRWSTISIRMRPLAAQFLRQLFRRMGDYRPQLANAFVRKARRGPRERYRAERLGVLVIDRRRDTARRARVFFIVERIATLADDA